MRKKQKRGIIQRMYRCLDKENERNTFSELLDAGFGKIQFVLQKPLIQLIAADNSKLSEYIPDQINLEKGENN